MLNIDKINKALLDPMAKARGLRSVFGQTEEPREGCV